MKKTLTFVSMLALAACSGGDGGSLHPTHGTSTGGASNQPAYYANFKQYFDNVIKTGADGGTYTNFVENTQNWPSQGGYKHYAYKEHTYTPGFGQITTQHTVDEKEMQLANYGIHNGNGYIHNREGIGANLYAPVSGTTFTGGTLAYLDYNSTSYSSAIPDTRILIKGDATYTYNSLHPELVLDFDDYYTFDIIQQEGSYETIDVSGTNNTGHPVFNVTPGHYVNVGADTNFTSTHLQKGGVQEAAGTYEMKFGDETNLIGDTPYDFTMHGAFGGTHE